jgi:putative MFS transporter
MDAGAASSLLARSAFMALPGILMVTWLYHKWSSIKALVLFIALTALSLLAFFLLSSLGILSTAAIVIATASLLISASGVIAMLIPYAAEIYPVHLRGTGSGVIAASSKFGGILGAIGGVLGVFNDMGLSAVFIAAPMMLSAIMLIRSGIDTRGRNLEEIQDAMSNRRLVSTKM